MLKEQRLMAAIDSRVNSDCPALACKDTCDQDQPLHTELTVSQKALSLFILMLEISFLLTSSWLLLFNMRTQLNVTSMDRPFMITPEKAYTPPVPSPLPYPVFISCSIQTA